ncbi:hypothetical protein ACVBE9_00025 [Eionea flava]
MMKTLKFVTFSIIILASISAALIYYAFSHVDDHIIDIIEKTGSDVTQSTVEVDRAVINLQYGSGSLYNLSLKNPAAYSDRVMYASNKVAFKVDMSTLNAPVIVINKVDINDIYFYIETATDSLSSDDGVNLNEASNLQAMIDVIANDVDILGLGSDLLASPDAEVKQPVKIMIERVTFADAAIEWQVGGDNKAGAQNGEAGTAESTTSRTLTAPGFFIENLGDKTTGLSVDTMARAILQPLFASIQSAIEQKPAVKGYAEDPSAQDRLGEQLLQAITSPQQSD